MCLLETDGFVWDKERGKINAEKDAWAKYLKVCGTFSSILAKRVLGANERVSLGPPEGGGLQAKAFG